MMQTLVWANSALSFAFPACDSLIWIEAALAGMLPLLVIVTTCLVDSNVEPVGPKVGSVIVLPSAETSWPGPSICMFIVPASSDWVSCTESLNVAPAPVPTSASPATLTAPIVSALREIAM
jgi:hypothetical protein